MAALRVWLRKLLGDHQAPEPDDPGTPLSHADEPTPLAYTDEPRRPTNLFVEENNDFALAMYGLLQRQAGKNQFFSPFSIRTALAMTQAGARGQTAAQMRDALRISSTEETFQSAFAQAIQELNAARGGEYEMAVANSLWGQDGAPLLPGFVELIAAHYGAGLNLVDFRRGAETARVAMNQWVAEKTRQKIRDLIPAGSLNVDTRLVLINAVYFKGLWVSQFRKSATRSEPFYLEDGGEVKVPLMRRHGEVQYMQGAGYQAVDLIYRGGDMSLLVLLPDRRNGLRDLEKKLSVRMLDDCVGRMASGEVDLFLPRFQITWGAADLCDPLATLGMPLAFSASQADFSGINGREPGQADSLFLSAVFHKAYVEVDEEGTEAAAATAAFATMAAALRPPPVPVFRADHPFLFAIRARKSGTILFLGSMADPTQGR